jgi:PAS domain-containing protein
MADMDSTEAGYFAMRDPPESPGSIHGSDSMSIHLAEPTAETAALTALQYLPVPVLVLSSDKTVVVANEAMGRLLGIDFESTAYHDFSISEVLQDKTMGELGIDILQNGSPLLMTWEVRPLHTKFTTGCTADSVAEFSRLRR